MTRCISCLRTPSRPEPSLGSNADRASEVSSSAPLPEGVAKVRVDEFVESLAKVTHSLFVWPRLLDEQGPAKIGATAAISNQLELDDRVRLLEPQRGPSDEGRCLGPHNPGTLAMTISLLR